MTKLRKQRRRKVYKHNVNRKRLRNRQTSKGSIGCKEIKNAWDQKKSVQANLSEMGLSYDPNQTIKIPKRKKQLQEAIGVIKNDGQVELDKSGKQSKKYIAEALEADAKAPREKKFRLPKSQVEWLTYLIKKYGTDYKAMARDSKNYYQETWKQLRQKIRTFRKIPEQYEEFLRESGVQPIDSDGNATDDEL
ncbi:nucleolar protein 16 [Anthonomus grandis grandis]|uniref:nucleolar protein 16 n=1 Tax=Anthonomus grandis grandis TaxID=2921223 RepID=UPI0021659A1A|nr:nucleolar protein 16 [Anthonomus grandis grandis]